jgi:putative transposase
MTTNEYIRGVHAGAWPAFERRLWHRDYYEHIVRDEADLERIRRYVAHNS